MMTILYELLMNSFFIATCLFVVAITLGHLSYCYFVTYTFANNILKCGLHLTVHRTLWLVNRLMD